MPPKAVVAAGKDERREEITVEEKKAESSRNVPAA